MEEMENYFATENFVQIVRKQTQQYLIELVEKQQPKQILEIGTAIGYSGILMLSNCKAHLTTVELIEKRFFKGKTKILKKQI